MSKVKDDSSKGGLKRKSDVSKSSGSKRPRSTTPTVDKPNWEKNAEARARFNKLYNQIQKKELSDAERSVFVAELWDLVKGKVSETASRHDTSRCLQSLCRFGTKDMRETMLKELSEKLVPMAKGSYSSFLVIGFIKYGDDAIKMRVLKELKNNFVQLSSHSTGARVVDAVMRMDTDSDQVLSLRQRLWDEFLGQEYMLFASKDAGKDSEGSSLTLAKLEGLSDKQKSRVILTMGNLVKKQADKGLLRYAYAQRVLNDYMNICSVEELISIIPTVRDACIAMASSPMGVECMVKCIEFADAKERKKIVKLLKSHVLELASHEFGYKIVLALLLWLDDTVLLQKSIVGEMFSDHGKVLDSLVEPSSSLSKVLLQLVAPGNKYYFTGGDWELVSKPLPASSKKDSETRSKELLKTAGPALIDICSANLASLIIAKNTCDLVTETFKFTFGVVEEHSRLLSALRQMLETDIAMADEIDEESDEEDMRLWEHPVAHVVYKRCLSFESSKDVHDLAQGVAKLVKGNSASFVTVNRPAMVLCALLETPSAYDELKDELKSLVGDIQTALEKHQAGKSAKSGNRGRGLAMLLEKIADKPAVEVKTPAKDKAKRKVTQTGQTPSKRSTRKKKKA